MSGYRKLGVRYKQGGLRYTIYRGLKYVSFLIKRSIPRRTVSDNSISIGKLKLVLDVCGIKLFYNNVELTDNVGLNMAICALGTWTDSSKGTWKIFRKDSNSLVIQNQWHYLPISLVWHLNIINEGKIIWEIELVAEEDIKIDQKRAIIVFANKYKRWSAQGREECFFESNDESAAVNFNSSRQWLGLHSAMSNKYCPEVILKFSEIAEDITSLAQRLKIGDNNFVHLLGIDIVDKDNNYFLPGRYKFLSAEINVTDQNGFKSITKDIKNNIITGKQHSKNNHLKVLLLNLPWQRDGRWGVRAGSRWPHIKDGAEEGNYLPFPFFLSYSASLLRKHGFEAYLIDAIAEKIPEDRLVEKIDRIGPDLLVAETSTPSLNYDLALLERIRNKNFKICLCGPDSNIRNPEFIENHKFIDYILVGEYELVLLNLVKSLIDNKGLSNVRGLIHRESHTIKVNPPGPLVDLDALPWPLREELPMKKYLDTPGGMPLSSVQMLASRGCPFGCNFCLWPQVMYHGNKYRTRNIIDVVDEMEYLVNEMGFRSIYFDDDTFNIGKERMLRLCREIKNRGLEKIPWAIMARADLMDEEILTRMKEAGLAAVKYGVESAAQELIDNCAKNLSLKKTEQAILFTKNLGIKTHLTFTFGLPGETKSTIQKTIDYVLKLKPFSVQFSIATPFPGTSYFSLLDKKGLIINKNWDDYDGNYKSVIASDSLTSRDLESARLRAYTAWSELSSARFDSPKGYRERFEKAYKDGGLVYGLKKTSKYLMRKNVGYLLNKIRNNYLDILGIFNGEYAFKGPNVIQIDLTDYCNNNCIACWCNSPLLSEERLNKPKDILPTKLVKRLIAETFQMGTREIYFSGGGEPFMHPDILDIIHFAKKIGIRCSINTNFTLIDEKTIQKFIELKVDHLTVSVWAGTADIYKALHPNKDKKQFYRIRKMLSYLNSQKDIHPFVKIYNVICNINYHQIEKMLKFAQETKSDSVEFTVVDTMPNATDTLILSEKQRKAVLEQCSEIKEKAEDCQNNHNPKVLNLEQFLRRVSNPDAQQARYDSQFINSIPCYAGWIFARIMPNGDVNPCLKAHRFPIGNIHKHSFKKIWNSREQRYFRKKTLRAGKDDPFFALIGNDADCKIGCYKSCDDIGRNISMHSRINALAIYEKRLLNILGKVRLLSKLIA